MKKQYKREQKMIMEKELNEKIHEAVEDLKSQFNEYEFENFEEKDFDKYKKEVFTVLIEVDGSNIFGYKKGYKGPYYNFSNKLVAINKSLILSLGKTLKLYGSSVKSINICNLDINKKDIIKLYNDYTNKSIFNKILKLFRINNTTQ